MNYCLQLFSAKGAERCSYIAKSTLTLLLLFVSTTLSSLLPTAARAQQLPVHGLYSDYERVLQDQGLLPLRMETQQPIPYQHIRSIDTLSFHPWSGRVVPFTNGKQKDHFTLIPFDLAFDTYWRATRPGGGNDGAIWQGRGFTTAWSAGLFLRYRFLSAAVRPQLIYTQNRSFALSRYPTGASYSNYTYPLARLDAPQRFGDHPFWTLDPGPSYIRADIHGWAAGISNENMWWSPALQNSILMSNNAPGFQHFFIETGQPKDIYIGKLKAKLIWGKLYESAYFDSVRTNNERYVTGAHIAFTPKPLPGLTLGINRIFYETIPPEGIPAGDLFQVFEALTKVHFVTSGNGGGNDESDQLFSLFGRWVFPKSGFEIYGEWARNDHSWNWRDFFSEPGHSRAYTFGLQKTFSLPGRNLLAVNAELTQLEVSKTDRIRPVGSYYVHSRATQGYTNEGQLVGASIGPGANSQYLGGRWFFGRGRLKVWTQRIVYNNDFLYHSNAMLAPEMRNPKSDKYWLHNTELKLGSSLTWFYRRWEATAGFTLGREFNEDYIFKNDHTRFAMQLSFRYRLSQLR